ncbi:MAG: T9SS type A sorting domain-containing protein [Bacteroidetes bacterium]|jgi:hypothetical protein|nr:T9SS type A sorting domain-containing protein [Bacteroidota bacterium]
MKKTLLALLTLALGVNVNAQTLCTAGEILGISESINGGGPSGQGSNCSATISFPNIAVLSVMRNGVKNGILIWAYRANNGQPFQSLPAGWNGNNNFNSIEYADFTTANNGEYRVIFIEAGTGCTDTIISQVTVNSSPLVNITKTNQCNGVLVTATDGNNPSGTGNTYDWNYNGFTSNASVLWTGLGGMGSAQYCVIKNSLGCKDGKSSMSLFPQPGVYTLTATKRKILPGQQSKLTAASNYPVAFYKWFKNGVIIPGAASNQYTVLWPDTGNYRVRMQHTVAAGNCNVNKFITIKEKIVLRAGDDMVYDAQLTAYPNPASDKIFIGGHEEMVEIYSMSGTLVFRETFAAPVAELSIVGLENGLYIVRSGEQYLKISVNH